MRRLLLELGVLATLLASFLTVPLPLPHVVTATVWLALTGVHVARRHRIYVSVLRSAQSSAAPTSRRHQRRVAATTVLVGCTAVVALSGFAQWAGVAAAIPWHAGSSALLIILAVTHGARRLWRRRYRRTAFRSHRELFSVCKS